MPFEMLTASVHVISLASLPSVGAGVGTDTAYCIHHNASNGRLLYPRGERWEPNLTLSICVPSGRGTRKEFGPTTAGCTLTQPLGSPQLFLSLPLDLLAVSSFDQTLLMLR